MNAKAWLTLVVAGMLVCFAPSQVGAEERALADNAWQRRDFEEAARLYPRVLRTAASDGRSWFRYAHSLHNLERFEEAIPAYRRSAELKYAILTGNYNVACALAQMGKEQEALDELEKAVAAGYTATRQMQSDADLVNVFHHKRFRDLLLRTQDPVDYYPEGREANWLRGAWQGDGTMVVANRVAKGFARQVELVVDGSRALVLFLYFSAHSQEWQVVGRDGHGTLYTGSAELRDGSLVCTGKRLAGVESEEVRATVAQDGAVGRVAIEVRKGSGWSAVSSYTLERLEPEDGGR